MSTSKKRLERGASDRRTPQRRVFESTGDSESSTFERQVVDDDVALAIDFVPEPLPSAEFRTTV